MIDRHNGFFALLGTLAIAAYTIVLARVSGRQAELTRQSIELGNKEFIAAYRPKLRIRRITVNELEPGQAVTAKIEVANVGGSDAIICQIGFDTFFRYSIKKSGISYAAFNASPKPAPKIVIPVGMKADISVIGNSQHAPIEIASTSLGGRQFCLLGIINYLDKNENIRSTSFFRIYDSTLGRFRKAPEDDLDGDREYED